MKSRVEVTDGEGRPVGTIVQQNVFGKKRFALEGASGDTLGGINAENWRAWDFSIEDETGAEVGRGLLRAAPDDAGLRRRSGPSLEAGLQLVVGAFGGIPGVAVDSHRSPDCLDYPERPRARKEAVGAGEGAAEGKREDEAAMAAFQSVHDHHEGEGCYPEGGEQRPQSARALRGERYGLRS